MKGRVIPSLTFAAVMLVIAGCQTYQSVQEPMFTGRPNLEALRPEIKSLEGLGFPQPKFEVLRFAFEHGENGSRLGSLTITRRSTRGSYILASEKLRLRTFSGKCVTLQESETVSLGGLLRLQSTSTVWSPNCTGWGAGQGRDEVSQITYLSGSLFPMKPGNKLELHHKSLLSRDGTDDGMSEYGQNTEETFAVVRKISDYQLSNGTNIGDVFLLNATTRVDGEEITSREVLFSEKVGWTIGYTTDVRARLVSIRE